MPRYAQIDKMTGEVIAVSHLNVEIDLDLMIPISDANNPLGMLWDGIQFIPIDPTPELEIPVADFLDRWTLTELTSLYAVAETDVRARAWVDWLKARTIIRLDSETAIEGKSAVVRLGVLNQARADEVFGY